MRKPDPIQKKRNKKSWRFEISDHYPRKVENDYWENGREKSLAFPALSGRLSFVHYMTRAEAENFLLFFDEEEESRSSSEEVKITKTKPAQPVSPKSSPQWQNKGKTTSTMKNKRKKLQQKIDMDVSESFSSEENANPNALAANFILSH